MKRLLDTNICIYIINARPAAVLQRFQTFGTGDIGVSSITAGELACGVAKSGSVRNRHALEAFLLPLAVVPFDLDAAFSYGTLRSDLERRGEPIGPLDLQIAAHALALGVPLVTNNLREFSRVKGLALENWA